MAGESKGKRNTNNKHRGKKPVAQKQEDSKG